MNKAFSHLLLAAAIGFSATYAKDDWAALATDVEVCLDHSDSSSSADVTYLPLSPSAKEAEKGKPKVTLSSASNQGMNWAVVNVPIEIKAQASKKPARFVKELKLDVYVVFRKAKRAGLETKGAKADPKDYFVVKKDVTLVRIPMERSTKTGDGFDTPAGYAKVSVPLFISPESALLLSGYYEKLPEKVTVAAYHIEPSFEGRPCRKILYRNEKDSVTEKIFDNAFSKTCDGKKWWNESSLKLYSKAEGAELLTIAETPYAPYYATLGYVSAKPGYGPAPVESAEKESGSEGSGSTATADE